MRLICNFLFLLIFSTTVLAQTISIGDTGDHPTLSSAATAITPGDTLLFQSQTFDDGTQFLVDVNGTTEQPIVLKSEILHGAVFQGGTESIHLSSCSNIIIDGFIIEQQTGNGMNIDDGGSYTIPSVNVTIKNCIFRDMNASGNNDMLKMSGVDFFTIENCQFINGSSGGGAGIDFVGCHYGTIQDCTFENTGTAGIQNKGGTQHILIQRNTFKNISQRALNLGGSTGLQFFRPPLSYPIVDAFEAADIQVYANIFVGSWAPIAYVGCVRVDVSNNTFYAPDNWVIRILQETTEPGFLTCADNSFTNNIIYLASDLVEANIGPNTDAASFTISHNLWFNESNSNWQPNMPVVDPALLIADPLFLYPPLDNFLPLATSPAAASGSNDFAPDIDYLENGYNNPPSRGAFEINPLTSSTHIEVQDNCISLYPNPFTNSVQIDGDFANANIQITNASGQVFQNLNGVNSPHTINLYSLPSGMYFVRIESSLYNKLQLKKIIKW